MKNKILISTSSFGAFDQSPLEALHQEGYDVMLNPHKRKLTKEESFQLLSGVTGLLAGLETQAAVCHLCKTIA